MSAGICQSVRCMTLTCVFKVIQTKGSQIFQNKLLQNIPYTILATEFWFDRIRL